MEIAALEIARMAEEIDCLRAELISVHEAKMEAEAHLTSFSDRVMETEQEIREECYAEFEKRSPTKRRPLGERDDVRSSKGEGSGLSSRMEGLRVSEDGNPSPNKALRVNSQGSPTKKVRKLGNRKWDASAGEDDLF